MILKVVVNIRLFLTRRQNTEIPKRGQMPR